MVLTLQKTKLGKTIVIQSWNNFLLNFYPDLTFVYWIMRFGFRRVMPELILCYNGACFEKDNVSLFDWRFKSPKCNVAVSL